MLGPEFLAVKPAGLPGENGDHFGEATSDGDRCGGALATGRGRDDRVIAETGSTRKVEGAGSRTGGIDGDRAQHDGVGVQRDGHERGEFSNGDGDG